jgi:transcriptional regulator GlxA family with amidase domain
MILECLKFVIKHSEEKTFNSPAMKLKELIDQDIKFASNIDELSRQVGLSRDHIRLLFKKSFYITPQEYRHQLRMNRVNELLENSSLSIKEIADLTGYKYPSHLCKEYKKNFGLTLKQMQDHFYCSGI